MEPYTILSDTQRKDAVQKLDTLLQGAEVTGAAPS
jgi:hypothetical protein